MVQLEYTDAVNQDKLNQFLGQMVGELGAAMNGALVLIGEKLGLYKAMAGAGPMTPAELARKTSTDERYVREWLSAQAAGGYMTYDAATKSFTLPEEQAFALAMEDSPAYMPGAFHIVSAIMKDEPKLTEAFRTGDGVGWDEHDASLFLGTEKFFRPNYAANLVSAWIPALDGVEAKLKTGVRVADIGCGHGASTILMAQAYPNSRLSDSIITDRPLDSRGARRRRPVLRMRALKWHGRRIFMARKYDFVTFFDCLHDMGDPVGAAKHVLEMMNPDGVWMIVEPFAHDTLEKNLNPVGRLFYAASTMICTPASRAQEVGLCLGAQAGEQRMREVVIGAGFKKFRRATETPFNLIYEAKA